MIVGMDYRSVLDVLQIWQNGFESERFVLDLILSKWQDAVGITGEPLSALQLSHLLATDGE